MTAVGTADADIILVRETGSDGTGGVVVSGLQRCEVASKPGCFGWVLWYMAGTGPSLWVRDLNDGYKERTFADTLRRTLRRSIDG